MLPLKSTSIIERRLNRHATTILIGGVFLTLCGLLFLALCTMPCDDKTYGLLSNDLSRSRSKAFWQQHFLAPSRDLKAFLVVIVISTPEKHEERDSIRETWLSQPPSNVLSKFVIGTHNLNADISQSIQREYTTHGDLLLLQDLTDSYKNLTAKLIRSLQWVDQNVDYKFLLKTDDDSFVKLGLLVRELQQKSDQRLYWGFFNGRAHVKKSGKWAEPDWFLCDRYVPYALGGGYVISSDLVHYISSNTEYLQQYLSEDVSLGTWLGPLKINRVHDERFDTEFVSRGCQNNYLITHKQSAASMRDLYNNLQMLGHMCKTETIKRESYIYNWNVLPSQCCARNDKILP